jgi:hypothetical protein
LSLAALSAIALLAFFFRKEKPSFELFSRIDGNWLFLACWFALTWFLATSSRHIIILFTPVAFILAALLLVEGFHFLRERFKAKRLVDIVFCLVVIGLLASTLPIAFSLKDSEKPDLTRQWLSAFGWLKENTPESSTIASANANGYWLQYFARRPTLTDSGGLDHPVTRQNLTVWFASERDQDFNRLLAAMRSKADYLLLSVEDLERYGTYSYVIDENKVSLESIIGIYKRNNILPLPNGQVNSFQGTAILSQDLELDGVFFPAGSSHITAIKHTVLSGNPFSSPPLVQVNSGNKVGWASVSCLVEGKRRIEFLGQDLEACLVFIPSFREGMVTEKAAVFLVPEKAMQSLAVKAYLLSEEVDFLESVYDDSENVPLALVNGLLVGPIKIWRIEE